MARAHRIVERRPGRVDCCKPAAARNSALNGALVLAERSHASGMLAALLAGRLILLTHLAQDRKRNFMGRASA